MKKQHWLDITEYVCFTGSVLGTIAAATSGQVIYAAAPLTLAFSVGIANRKRLDNLLEQQQKADLTELQKSFLEDLDRVDGKTAKLKETLHLQAQEQQQKLEATISQLTSELETLKPCVTKAISSSENLHKKLFEVRQTLDRETQQQEKKLQEAIKSVPTQLQQLIKRLEPLENQQQEIINQRLPLAVSAIEDLQAQTAAIAPLESNFCKIETAITLVQKRLDLNPLNFQGKVLKDADFSNTYLKHAKLVDANLSGVNWDSVCLNSAALTDVDLSSAKLIGADLGAADLSYANMNHANLSGVDLSSANLSGVDLSFANLTDADLSNANLTGANLTNANLSGVILSGADLSGADVINANLSYAVLSKTNLSNTNLCGAKLLYAEIHDVDLTGTLIDKNTKLDRHTKQQLESLSNKTNGKNLYGSATKITDVNHNNLNLRSQNFLEGKSNQRVVVRP